MAFPSSTGSSQLSLQYAWQSAMGAASSIKSQAQTLIAQIQGSNVPASALIVVPGYAAQWIAALNSYAAVSGIASYAQAQVGNPSLDVVGAFNAMVSAIQGVANWITANTPKDVNGNLLVVQYNGNGALTYTTFTTAQLAGLTNALTTLVGSID